MDDLLNELLRLRAKGEFDAFGSSEQVGDDRKGTAFHPIEQKRRSTVFDDAAMDFSDLEARIDFGIDGDEIAFPAQNLKELSEVLNGHVRRRYSRVKLARGNDSKRRRGGTGLSKAWPRQAAFG